MREERGERRERIERKEKREDREERGGEERELKSREGRFMYLTTRRVYLRLPTLLAGGGVPAFDEVILGLKRMDSIVEVDASAGTVVAEAGVVLEVLEVWPVR